jgi:hypothetical protein
LHAWEPHRSPFQLGDHPVANDPGRVPVEHFLHEPDHPDCRIAVDTSGTVYAVGTKVPASERLETAALLEGGAAFLRVVADDGITKI